MTKYKFLQLFKKYAIEYKNDLGDECFSKLKTFLDSIFESNDSDSTVQVNEIIDDYAHKNNLMKSMIKLVEVGINCFDTINNLISDFIFENKIFEYKSNEKLQDFLNEGVTLDVDIFSYDDLKDWLLKNNWYPEFSSVDYLETWKFDKMLDSNFLGTSTCSFLKYDLKNHTIPQGLSDEETCQEIEATKLLKWNFPDNNTMLSLVFTIYVICGKMPFMAIHE